MKRKTAYTNHELQELFNGKKVSPQLNFSFKNIEDADATKNLSISGVQEKVSALVDNGKIRLVKNAEQGTHILKPAPSVRILDRKELPANEHLTMQLANVVYGINTAKNSICYASDDELIYITKRFDVKENGSKYRQEDFSVLTNHVGDNGESYKYDGSYEDIAMAIKNNIPSYSIALDEFFKLIIFNYIYANGDAHLKNFSVLINDNEVFLSPAYDLINTAMHVQGEDLALKDGLSKNIEQSDVYEHTGHLCKTDFERFGQHIGLPDTRIKKTITQFLEFPKGVYKLIENSYLRTDKLKRTYIKIIEERRKRFIRESE